MEIQLNRGVDVAIRDQLRFQLELKILSGDLWPGQRLPSVRTLARQLHLHPNTVSAAYRDLEATGQVELRKGAGVFVRSTGEPGPRPAASPLEELVRPGLQRALRRGFGPREIRAALDRWLPARPPDRVVAVDSTREMGELMAAELRRSLPVPVSSCSLAELEREPDLLAGALGLALPYHVEAVARLATGPVDALTIEVAEESRRVLLDVPGGSQLLFVSHAPSVLGFARVLLQSLRGDQLQFEAWPLSATREWRRLAPVADLVLADACAFEAVRAERPRRLLEVRVLARSAVERLRLLFELPAPAA
jgi:DNA-binding transcriptional regulator YhcF (GntR family)